MTVSELIKELSKFRGSRRVMLESDGDPGSQQTAGLVRYDNHNNLIISTSVRAPKRYKETR